MDKCNSSQEALARFLIKIKVKTVSLLRSFPKEVIHKLAMLAGFSIALTILLAPQIQFQSPTYVMGAIVTGNIKADRDFLVEMKAATEQKKMEAFNEILSVYDYDAEAHVRILANLSRGFTYLKENSGENLIYAKTNDEDALQQIKKSFENYLGASLSDEEVNIFFRNWTPLHAGRLSELIRSAYDSGMITNVTFLQQEKDRGILIRDIRSQDEKRIRDLSKILHINDVVSSIMKSIAQGRYFETADVRKAYLSLAVKLLRPNLVFNKNATDQKKDEAVKDIKPVYIKVLKNEMLAREGEKITATTLDKLEAYSRIKGERKLSNLLIFIGMFFIITFCILILYHPAKQWLKCENRDLSFLSLVCLLQVIIAKAGIFVSRAITDAFPVLSGDVFTYPIPFTLGPMLVSLFISCNPALIVSMFLSLVITFLFDGKISVFLFSFLGSVTASQLIVDCRKRTAFIKVGLVLGIVNVAFIVSFGLIYENIFTFRTVVSIAMGFFGGIVSGILVSGLSPVFESLFQYSTDIKLLELANLNQPIFQQMIMEAPGTYHHSIVVASMVETAADTIGANSLLAKVSAYYHDIGKMKKPLYFIENQQNGDNKHDKLTPKMSSLVIISHVKDGCDLAMKEKLGIDIINIIREHHGTSLVSYFYEKSRKDQDPSIRSLPETDFRYPGPKPQTREAGLVLLGDVVEASSRILSNPTPSRIRSLVRERIVRVFSDGQLDECELTLHDLNKIAESFIMILNGLFHHRIEYPEPMMRHMNGVVKEINNGIADKKQAKKNKGKFETAQAVGE